jgi:hypothetical protein
MGGFEEVAGFGSPPDGGFRGLIDQMGDLVGVEDVRNSYSNYI